MKRTLVQTVRLRLGGLTPAAVVLAAAYTIGVVLGSLMARAADAETLSSSLDSCLEAVQAGTLNAEWLPLIWKCVRFPAVVFLFGFSVLGLAVVPTVLGMDGFTLAFSISAFLWVYGLAGYIPALAAFGLGGFVTMPALIILGMQSWQASGRLAERLNTGRKTAIYGSGYWENCALCGLLTILRILIEKFAVLPLLAAAIEKM